MPSVAMSESRTTVEERLKTLPDADLVNVMRQGDAVAREAARTVLFTRYLWIAHYAARRYAGRGEERAVLDQVAAIGLLEAISRFDPRRAELPAFAFPTALGELKRHFRDRRRWVRVPRRVQELCLQIAAAQEQLTHRNSRRPSLPEVASYLGVAVSEVEQAALSTALYCPASLDAPVLTDATQNTTLGDLIGAEDTGYGRSELLLSLEPAVRKLSPRERELLRLRFWGGCTQSEIGERMGISQMHVSRLLRQTIDRLRTQVAPTTHPDSKRVAPVQQEPCTRGGG